MKQVILRITTYHPTGRATHSVIHSYPMYAYQVKEYIAKNEPTDTFKKITDVYVIDVED